MLDSIVLAPWPRGLFLAKKLSEGGQKTAYVEILPRRKNPLGLFLDESCKEEKEFLESLGFLSRQKGGFCLLSPEGTWPLQDMREMKKHKAEFLNKNFDEHWLAYLSLNLAGKVFEYNNSEFSETRLPLFSDYFLFDPSLKKEKQFKKDQPLISFYQALPENIFFEKIRDHFHVQNEILKSNKRFWLGEKPPSSLSGKKWIEPCWKWEASFWTADFGDYEDIIPSHFVSIRNLFLPWSHDNLLSAFHRAGNLEVWMRWPYKGPKEDFVKGVKRHLKAFFPDCGFSPVQKKSPPGLIAYRAESLSQKTSPSKSETYIESLSDFFQGDLASEIRAEGKLFNSLSL